MSTLSSTPPLLTLCPGNGGRTLSMNNLSLLAFHRFVRVSVCHDMSQIIYDEVFHRSDTVFDTLCVGVSVCARVSVCVNTWDGIELRCELDWKKCRSCPQGVKVRVVHRVFSQNLVDERGVPSGPLERYRKFPILSRSLVMT